MNSVARANSAPVSRALSADRGKVAVPSQPFPKSGNTVVPLRPPQLAPATAASRSEEPARPAERLARVIYMASVGGYMAVHHNHLVEVNGRMVWPDAEALARDALTVGVVASTLVINTART